MASIIKFISGCTAEIAPATCPAPAPRQLFGWPHFRIDNCICNCGCKPQFKPWLC